MSSRSHLLSRMCDRLHAGQVSDCNSKAACQAAPSSRPSRSVSSKVCPTGPRISATSCAWTRRRQRRPPTSVRSSACSYAKSCLTLRQRRRKHVRPDRRRRAQGGRNDRQDRARARNIIDSNAMLFEMILRLVGCCAGKDPVPTTSTPTTPTPSTLTPTTSTPTTPTPTTPTPTTPEPGPTLRVKGIDLVNKSGATLKSDTIPGDVPTVPMNSSRSRYAFTSRRRWPSRAS